jgi:hypothetical protein
MSSRNSLSTNFQEPGIHGFNYSPVMINFIMRFPRGKNPVDRSGQILIIPGIWMSVLIFSSLWLKHFRFGPLEWL